MQADLWKTSVLNEFISLASATFSMSESASHCIIFFTLFIILNTITPLPLPAPFCGSLCYIAVHEYKVACAACHAEKVEDFMGAEVLVDGIEKRQFQGVNDTSDGINDAAGK